MRTIPLIAVLLLAVAPVMAQQPAQPAQPAQTARAAAPIDLTGQWVSVITEDWRWRMVTPPKGDYQSVPITAEAKRVADRWDPAKDTAAGEQCRSYGAAGLMRLPTRVRISWVDDNTLKVESDAGMQTRLLYFAPKKAPEGRAGWQGDSMATWDVARVADAPSSGGGPAGVQQQTQRNGTLKVVTTRMRPGYLRKNGVPYSADAVLTEHWDVYRRDNGDQWLVITTSVEDPKYLQGQYLTTPNFKKETDTSKWNPTPCSATW